jgi:hypothetical protein
MLAEVEQIKFDGLASGPGKQHLAAVAGGRDTGSEVDIRTDVALLRQVRLPGVETDPNAHGPIGPGRRCLTSCLDGSGGGWESDEERIALGVHFDTAVS